MSMSYRPSSTGEEAGRTPVTSSEPLSLIDRYSSIEGTFTTSRDVRVEGVVRGRLDCQGLLYIAEGADIDATVEAASITVAGKLNGEVTCRGRLQITSTGRMVATVTTDSLVIDEGAFYEGDLNMRTSGGGSAQPSRSRRGGSSSPSVLRRFSGEDEETEDESPPRRGSASS